MFCHDCNIEEAFHASSTWQPVSDATGRNSVPLIIWFAFFVLFSLHCFFVCFFFWGGVHCRIGVMSWFPMFCRTRLFKSWVFVFITITISFSCDSFLYFVHLTSSWTFIDLSEFLHYTCMSEYSRTNWNLGTSVSSTNNADRHDITEILLKLTFNTLTITIVFLLSDFK